MLNKLLQNERTKLYKKVSTWILMGVIVALMLFTLGIVKLSNVLMSSGGGTTWRENYEWNYTYAQRNADSDPMSYAEAQKFKYLLDNDIPPSDWRTDLVSSYWDQYKRVELEALEQLKNPLLAEEERAELELSVADARAKMAEIDALLADNDWRAYIQSRKDELAALTPDELGNQSPEEVEVQIEILDMYLEMGIQPVSTTMGYYGQDQTDAGAWKSEQLQLIQTSKLSLVRGESENNTPLTKTQRRELESNIEVALKRLSTDTPPVDSTSFPAMMDVSTSSLELVSLLLMVIAGGILATEFGTGTVKLLLITPHRRSKIFWSKALLLLEVILITSGAMFVMSFFVSGLFTGFSDLAAMQVTPLFGTVVRIPYLLFILLKYLLFLLPVIAYASLALMLSAVTRKSAVAIAVSILLMFGSEMVLSIVALVGAMAGFTIPGLKFLLFSNTSLSAYFPSSMGGMSLTGGLSSTVDGTMPLGFSVVILLIYTVCFLWIARDSFCRRDIK